ncbi:DUF4124 domain-containing protein [Microbulbifer sp. ALW1]|uniref:DUF4124 domain-containing protein n=1 Tax=Microbulbifer sp. (strain ALW1) TaxID=1516059 RepID=UPI001359C011|nr:DUF4124 domain-containing protein [Microbulbifer sp. ALW1]
MAAAISTTRYTFLLLARLLAGFVLVFSTSASSADGLYRWVDADGKVHFGDRPPLEAKVESLDGKLKPVNGATPTRREDYPDPKRAEDIEREYAQRTQSQQAEAWRQQQQACAQARRQLQILKGPVYFVDENGERSTISERQRQIEAKKLEDRVRQHCG